VQFEKSLLFLNIIFHIYNYQTIKTKELQNYKRVIHIKGARSNNLKNIELFIPKNKLIAVTGLSGSGKSSLVMDTLYAEGQRRYVESLSSYARQFLNRIKKPEVDFIKGICPAIAIEQKVGSKNARSTVGSMTEIYEYLRLLYARIGRTISPISGKEVTRHSVTDVVDYILSMKKGTKIELYIPLQQNYPDRTLKYELEFLLQKGYTRVKLKNELIRIEDILSNKKIGLKKSVTQAANKKIQILIDRFAIDKNDQDNNKRIADSVGTAFMESEGNAIVQIYGGKSKAFNNRFELDGMSFLEPVPQLFNYNNPYGACPRCEGYGKIMGIDENKVIPNKTKSLFDGAVQCWNGEKSKTWSNRFILKSEDFNFPIHRPYNELTKKQKNLLWEGAKGLRGINDYFEELAKKTYKIQNRVMLARYRGRTICNVCNGARLRPETSYVKIGKTSIGELIHLPIEELFQFFEKLRLNKYDQEVGNRILFEIKNRLQTMMKIGLKYLSLERTSATLSGGETQRINLTRTLGSNLSNSLYILDEPSIGLHPNDTKKLVEVLKNLRDLGNTVIVVEHEEDVIMSADHIIDIGPKAGIFGGYLVYDGSLKKLLAKSNKTESLTRSYLTGEMEIAIPENRRKKINALQIKGANQHNLKNINVTFPLNTFIAVSGVSGSGKTTLVKHILYPALKKNLDEPISSIIGSHEGLEGDLSQITQVEMINQNPIGKSSRSNPVTYVKAYDSIRKLFTDQQISKIRGYKPKHFSFNVEGGRCETCKGDGEIVVEMQFLADVKLQCEECRGQRFKREILDVKYDGKNIFDVLNLSIEESIEFFEGHAEIIRKIQPLFDVGLGYIKLGQASSTLSGGEAQRVKLASFLGKDGTRDKVFFIFDEPTTGLHFHDINKLLDALNALVENGHTVVVVEHNLEVLKSADWIIDLGPGAGKEGGNLVFEGDPKDLVKVKKSLTGKHLKSKM